MSQFELIEDYLTNRLDDGARKAFEQRMQGDPQLRSEVELQQGIIEGIKSARAAELKAMLNNVPIGGSTASAITGKVILATISAGIIGTALYFGLRNNQEEPLPPEQVTIEDTIAAEPENIEVITETVEEPSKETTKSSGKQAAKKKSEVKATSPKIDVMDLTEEMKDSMEETTTPKPVEKPTVSMSSIEVDTDNTSKVYTFHYQFKNDKLLLYGPFDSSLYEILEINGGSHTVFLFYRNSYYHLDELEKEITPLIMIRDFELLEKLEKFRKRK